MIQPNNPWTAKELSLLHKLYANTTNEDLAYIIGRTETAVAHKASKLKLRKSEAFLQSAASGRFRVKTSLYKRILNFFRSC